VANYEADNWRKNRPSSKLSQARRWSKNPVGALVRMLEFLYFGQPLINFFIGYQGNIELITHLSKSFQTDIDDGDLIVMKNVRIDLRENFVQIDTGHVLNSRKRTNEIYSGQYWNQIRDVRKSRKEIVESGNPIYPIAIQNYYYHFLLEELPEIISFNRLNPGARFISLTGQPDYVKELIDLSGIDLEITQDSLQGFNQVVIPKYLRSNTKWSVKQLHTLNVRAPEKSEASSKILLLRKGKVRANAPYEESLVNQLTPHGFTVFDPENYSCHEQIEVFSKASAVVGIHGAALSNIVFTSPNCSVFEIFSHPYRTYFFRELAKNNGNPYFSSEDTSSFDELKIWLKSL
jgi:capsular polysaccharide biosynthesis protein